RCKKISSAFAGLLLLLRLRSGSLGYSSPKPTTLVTALLRKDLSDLGATCHNATMPTPGSCEIFQPSSIIWNTVLSLVGILTIASAYMIYRGLGNRFFSSLVGFFGLGPLIAVVVTGNVGFINQNFVSL